MKQDRLNNYLLVYCHKSITDTLDTVKIACANEQRKWHFEKFEEGCAYVWVEDERGGAGGGGGGGGGGRCAPPPA